MTTIKITTNERGCFCTKLIQKCNDMRQQVVAQISENVFFSVPWGHHLYIISQCKDVDRAVLPTIEDIEATLSDNFDVAGENKPDVK